MPFSDHFWKLQCRESTRHCGAKHISKTKYTKYTTFGPLLEVEISKKYTPLWREAHFEVKIYEIHHVRTIFGYSELVSHGRYKGLCALSKVSKTWGFCRISKNNNKYGIFEKDLQRYIFRGKRSTKNIFMINIRRSGRWFPERGCILEHQICRCAKIILYNRYSISYDLILIFRNRYNTLDRWNGKKSQNILIRDCQRYTQFFIFEGNFAKILRKFRRIISFLMFLILKNKNILQNSLIFKFADR